MPATAQSKRSWLVDDAYAALKTAILANTFPPGHQLSAQELALQFGMSRTPVQEAALRLQQEGLLEILPKRGIRVLALSRDDLAEIYDVIIALEASAAAKIAGLPEERRRAIAQELSSETDRMERALADNDRAAWCEADAAFHQTLIERCGNRRFAAILATVNAQAHRARMLTVQLRSNLDASVMEHRAIIAAIEQGQPAKAERAARLHRTEARDELLPLLEKTGLRYL